MFLSPLRLFRFLQKIPTTVLDFSSGSDDDENVLQFQRKTSSAVDINRGCSIETGPGQMSLLQHGFYRLLERSKGRPEGKGGISSDCDENLSVADATNPDKLEKNQCFCKKLSPQVVNCGRKEVKNTGFPPSN